MKRWSMHDGALMRYDDYGPGPVVRITSAWPRPREQHHFVRLYPDGNAATEDVACESRADLADAVLLAEEWLQDDGTDLRIANAIIGRIGDGAPVADVIDTVSCDHPPPIVWGIYWQLIADNRIVRNPDGTLTLA